MIDNLKEYILKHLDNIGVSSTSSDIIGHLILLLFALLISWFIGYICKKMVSPMLLKLVKNTKFIWDDYFLNTPVVKAFCHIIPGIIFYALLPICLPEEQKFIYIIITQATKIYIAITFISLITAFLNNIETFTISEEKLKEKQLYGIIEFLKIVVYFIGGIIIIAFLVGKNPISMVAGIGAAATVLMLVFKDSILGLVAGIQLSTNKMLKPGDWITIKKLNIDGVVEQVSLTTVKIRNFDNTISTVPPYFLISDSFQNWAPMSKSTGRQVKRTLFIDMNSIKYVDNETIKSLKEKGLVAENKDIHEAVNLTLFREYTENYLRRQTYVNNATTILVRQLNSTPNGLPIELYYYSAITDFIPFENLAAQTIEHLIATTSKFGLRLFQSPTGYDIKSKVSHR